MGCGQSKIESEESVTRCKDRKEFMKKALSSRNAFAAAHSAYAVSLRNTGAALADYAHSEAHLFANPPSSSSAQNPQPASSSIPSPSSSNPAAAATIVQPPVDAPLPPPPPPLPDFTRLQRAASMPEFAIPNNKHAAASKAPADDVIQEEDGDADDEDEGAGDEPRRRRSSTSNNDEARPPPVATVQQQQQPLPPAAEKAAPVWLGDYIFNTDHMPGPSLSQPEPEETQQIPKAKEKVVIEQPPEPTLSPPEPEVKVPPPAPKPARKQRVQQQAAVMVGGEGKRGRGVGNSVNVKKVFDDIDDHFLKASESAHDVSKMLEATRMHYHSNFADNRGHIDHSARVMRAITWNRSCKGMKDENDGKDDFNNEELETHATILDKMLAWEKKLYDEVKAGELMKIDYQRKVALLNKQKKRGSSPETLEKTKAAVSHLHTRYIVDMQSMDSTVSEINRLRDKQLYPKLVDLVDGMATMWEKMFMHHSSQLKIALALRNLDISLSPKETSEQHHETTRQLYSILQEWHAQFQGLMKHQREYIQALNSWLKLNLIPIESNLRERVSSPPRVIQPQIQPLLQAWNDLLEKLPDDRPRGVIHTFAEVVRTIIMIQVDELKLKEKCDETRRECIRRSRAFDDWYNKYSEKKAAAAAAAAEAAAAAAATEDDVAAATAADPNQDDEIVAERKAVVESLMMKLRNEEESYRRTCKQVREKSVVSLKSNLPELFRALSEFALECSDMYKKLRAITTEPQDEVEGN